MTAGGDPPQTIADAVLALKKKYKIQIISSTNSFLTACYQRTPTAHVKVNITLTFPDGYNSSAAAGQQQALVVGIESGVNVPPGLKRKLEKELGELAVEKKGSTFHQVDTVLQRLVEFIDTNLFVPCWKELRQVVELINNSSKTQQQADTIGMNETKGLIRLNLLSKGGNYQYKCSITIDPAYPTTSAVTDYGKACRLKMESSTFPSPMETLITTQAQELVRRLQDGMSEKQALSMSNPIHLPTSTDSKKSSSTETPEQTWQREEKERLAMYGIPDGPYDGSHPQPSLLSLATFLRRTIHQLPQEECPSCHEKCLPTDPTALSSLYKAKTDKKAKRRRPVRVHCGHWYHLGCLETLMNKPPFGNEAKCNGSGGASCGQQLYHPSWPVDTACERERAYTQRQAREREIADAASCF